ncbi:MAG: hypothetical protein KAT61_04965 [Gammaproteobacteria bacterium]|nr:hypothetical protein [Gammaproteobacteria bacterium]NOQ69089.1 hypothetical protein [Gammaproteobacteria bacterium]
MAVEAVEKKRKEQQKEARRLELEWLQQERQALRQAQESRLLRDSVEAKTVE